MNQDFHTRLRLLACSFNNSIEVAQDQILLRTCLLRTRRFCSGPNICSGLVLRTKTTFAQDNSFKCKIYSFELINKLSMTNMGSSIVFSYFLLRLTKKTAIERIFAFFSYKFPFFFLYFFNSGSVAKFATNYKLTISAL